MILHAQKEIFLLAEKGIESFSGWELELGYSCCEEGQKPV